MPTELAVLLGAGASFPGMCSVADLTRFLVEWPDRREPPQDAAGSSPALLTLPTDATDSRRPLFAAIRDVVCQPLREPGLNFEQLIHVCEELATVFPLPQGDHIVDRFRLLVAPFLSPADATRHFNVPFLGFAAQDACNALLNHVSVACDSLSASSHPQARGLATLAGAASLRVFSLNYDDISWHSGIDFYDGFVGGRFEPLYPWPNDRHALCQLHGSVLWGPSQEPNSDLRRYDTRAEARDVRTRTTQGNYYNQDGHESTNVAMITGLRKADRILHSPYGTYFHAMRDTLLRSPTWLIVGYGFGDQHVNQMLAQARSNWRRRGCKQRIVVVDYYGFPHAEDGAEHAWSGVPSHDVLQRVVGRTFLEDLPTFLDTRPPRSVRRGELNRMSDEVAVWLDGAETAFTTNLHDIVEWLQLQ